MKNNDYEKPKRRRSLARSPEEKENQLISLAYDLAEEQLRNKTASSQVVTHFLKLATEKERLEREKLESENNLLKAKAKAIESVERMEMLYSDAIRVFSGYEYRGGSSLNEN